MRARNIRANVRVLSAAIWRLRWSLLGLLGALLAGMALFWVGEGRRPIEALYFTLNLITLQAGPADAPKELVFQAASIAIMVGGVLSVAGGAASIFQLVSDPKEQQLALASTFRDHIVVCGIGRVGFHVIGELLDFKENIVAVNATENEEWLAEFQQRGLPVIIGDARRRQILVQAGVPHANAIVACTSDDLTNLDIALDARDLNPNIKVVLRMFDTQLASKVSKGFNIQTAYSVSALAAPALAAAATRTKVDHSFRVKNQLLNLTTLTISHKSSWCGQSIGHVQRAANCSFVGEQGVNGMALHLDPAHVIRAGQTFSVIGSLDALRILQAGN